MDITRRIKQNQKKESEITQKVFNKVTPKAVFNINSGLGGAKPINILDRNATTLPSP